MNADTALSLTAISFIGYACFASIYKRDHYPRLAKFFGWSTVLFFLVYMAKASV